MSGMEDRLSRARLLLGNTGIDKLSRLRVILFGTGGVGSWCAEALIRTGLKHLTIVDGDRVCPSNINRQMMATSKTIGRVKVDAIKERLLEINPEAEITARNELFTSETADSFELGSYDFVVDAIDSLKDKSELILRACETDAVLLSSMGAALKSDPTRVSVAEFWNVCGCPLGSALRKRFRKTGCMPKKKFQCVYSEELLSNIDEAGEHIANGSLMHITAIFGCTLAGLIINKIRTAP